MPTRSLLLIDSDAATLAVALEQAVSGLVVTPCTSLVAARAHLVGSTFDAVLAAESLPDGSASTLFRLSLPVPPVLIRATTEARADAAEISGAHAAFVAGAYVRTLAPLVSWHLDTIAPEAQDETAEPLAPEAPVSSDPGTEVLESIGEEMSRIAHALNNPLAVIMGNAQLARELLTVAPEDPMVTSSIQDIGEAATELVALVDEVNVLRRQITAVLGDEED